MRRQAGFTYLALVFFVAVMGAVAASIAVIWSTSSQRNKEQQLLYVGGQFRLAIQQYYEHTPGMVKRYPPSLEDLLKDSRQAGTVRYLRRIYRDPVSGTGVWGIVRAPDGGVMGVYSTSERSPMKRAGFTEKNSAFAGASAYRDWKFLYLPIANPIPKN